MIWASAQTASGTTLEPFKGDTAPDQNDVNLTGNARTAPGPEIIASREPVGPLVGRLPGVTISAGSEVARVPQTFDLPSPLRRLFRRWQAGTRTTLLAPELQSEIDRAAGVEVMPKAGMAAPYVVATPGPWYDSFLKTIG
jgi:hypothetical protein